MTASNKDVEGKVVSSDGKIKAHLAAHRGLNHQTTGTVETNYHIHVNANTGKQSPTHKKQILEK